MQSTEIKDLATALVKAQSEMKGAVKDSSNPFFKSSYADLQSVWDACREPLIKNGLAVIQRTTLVHDTQMCLETILLHNSGQYITSLYLLKPTKDDPQDMGSAISYARRYSLAAMVGVYQKDDDGNAASEKTHHEDQGHQPMPVASAPLPINNIVSLGNRVFEIGKFKGSKYKDIAFGRKEEAFDYYAWAQNEVRIRGQTKCHVDIVKFVDYMSMIQNAKEEE